MTTSRETAQPGAYHPPGELLFDADAVQAAVLRQASLLRERLRDANPLILTVMQGGVYYAVWLTLALAIPLELDYVHVSRYRQAQRGGRLEWIRRPQISLLGRKVVVVDDVFDEGATLLAVREACIEAGVQEVLTTVLVRKQRSVQETVIPDLYVALEAPDRFIVGCGLDYADRWRNLPGLYALPKEG